MENTVKYLKLFRLHTWNINLSLHTSNRFFFFSTIKNQIIDNQLKNPVRCAKLWRNSEETSDLPPISSIIQIETAYISARLAIMETKSWRDVDQCGWMEGSIDTGGIRPVDWQMKVLVAR